MTFEELKKNLLKDKSLKKEYNILDFLTKMKDRA